jgi:hypothetical protein
VSLQRNAFQPTTNDRREGAAAISRRLSPFQQTATSARSFESFDLWFTSRMRAVQAACAQTSVERPTFLDLIE